MSSVFATDCFFFLRNPRGGVEDLDRMKAAGFNGVFCNIGDYPREDWEHTIRARALGLGMFCGPWARTQSVQGGPFDPARLTMLVDCAKKWGSPLIVNSEKEIDHTGSSCTTMIAEQTKGMDAALSCETRPFASVDWWPVREMPVLPQIFPAESGLTGDPDAYAQEWHAYGINCVFLTFGSYKGMTPAQFDLCAPYSIFTADDCGGNYAAWSPRSSGYQGCVEAPTPEDDMELIGSQDGIVAEYNRLRDLDPGGTLLVKDAKGKWPDLSTLDDTPIDKWKAYDKGQRRQQILKDDHDAQTA